MNDNTTLLVYSDGGARGNPGPAASAWLAIWQGKLLHQQAEYLGESTNNLAEYQALLSALTWLVNNWPDSAQSARFHLDSQLVVKQLTGEFKVKKTHLRPLFHQIQQLIEQLRQQGIQIEIVHIPREENQQADSLVNQALDQALQQ